MKPESFIYLRFFLRSFEQKLLGLARVSSSFILFPPVKNQASTPFGESYLGKVQGKQGPKNLPKKLG